MRYLFPCGCSWPMLEESPPEGVMPLLDFNIEEAPQDCPATWALLGRGETKGVFQLESKLGKQWTKKLKPECGEHLGALGALLRPGCLKAVDAEGVSMTQHYCRRKNGEEEVAAYHPVVDAILFPTYGVLTYQEQAMALVKAVAGFNLQEADQLRKAAGKKDPVEMAKVEIMFLEGAKKAAILTDAQAKEVFGWIKKSQRYSFNCCISGMERIKRPYGQPCVSVAELFLDNYGLGLSQCEDGIIRPNVIRHIQKAGVQRVYLVTLANQASITVTRNHKFPTNFGELTLAKIAAVLHADTDVQLFVCGEHGRDGYAATLVDIVSIEPVGEEMTYDVTMDAPNHNFVVGSNIVTCNSHAICYGLTGYDCAYIKAHFPLAFFTAWLFYAKDKQDPQQETFEMVNDARLFDITVEPPDVRTLEPHFHTDRKVVRFGLANVKGIGKAQIEKLKTSISQTEQEKGRALGQWSWFDFLVSCSDKLSLTVVTRLVEVGAMRCFGLPRQLMLAEYRAWVSLTDMEREWIKSHLQEGGIKILEHAEQPQLFDTSCKKKRVRFLTTERVLPQPKSLVEAMIAAARPKKDGGGASNRNRVSAILSQVSLLENPPTPIVDTPHWIAYIEEELLGISLTCAKIDSCDISQVNVSCKEYLSGRTGFLMFGVEVQAVREVKTKKGKTPGQKMAFLTLSDATCSLEDVVCFPETWKEYGELLTEGNTVILQGERDYKKDSNTLLVKKVWQAER